MKCTLTGGQLIRGVWIAANPKTMRGVNPGTGEALAPLFAPASETEVDAGMQSAAEAFKVTRELPPATRAQLLETISARIMDLGDDLLQRANLETGLPLPRLMGELARTCGQLKLFADLIREGSWVDAVIDTADAQRQPLPKPDLRRMARPLGPVVVFGASNFPFAYGACGGDTASALAAGNPVVVKAHERHPGVNELFAHAVLAALKDCGLPPGIFGLLQGPGASVGQALVKHPATQAVGFTGSKRAARALFDLAAARPTPIPVFAEMGSLNPLVLLPGALAERGESIAAGLAQSITAGVGQFCTKPGLVFVMGDKAAKPFVTQLTTQMAAMSPATMLAVEMRQNFCATTGAFQKIPGVRVRIANSPAGFATMAPSLFEVDSATWREQLALHEEAFGPGALIIRCRDFTDLLNTVSCAGGNLTASLHFGAADSIPDVRLLTLALEQLAGRLICNGYPTGVEVCPAMVHGGPYPATTAPGTSSVGALAIQRFVRPVAFQNLPDVLLPAELQNANPRQIWRTVNGERTKRTV